MHELTITQNILDIALKHAEKANANKVNTIYLVIGQLSSVVDDSVSFYWDMISKGTIAEGASLQFRRIPTKMACNECKKEYDPKPGDFACPYCGSESVSVIQGNEFFLEAIDIDSDADNG
jgi:hydrogenase nickel incorporation protein HypA/HybF